MTSNGIEVLEMRPLRKLWNPKNETFRQENEVLDVQPLDFGSSGSARFVQVDKVLEAWPLIIGSPKSKVFLSK